MTDAPAIPTAVELTAEATAIQEQIARTCAAPALRSDPVRLILTVFHRIVGFLLKLTRRWEGAVGEVIEASKPLTAEERAALLRDVAAAARAGGEDGSNKGVRAEARRMIRTFDRGLAVRIGLGVGCAYVAGALSTVGVLVGLQLGPFNPEAETAAAWRELVRDNPDPRPALSAGVVQTDPVTRRRYYAGVSLWRDPARPPPAATP